MPRSKQLPLFETVIPSNLNDSNYPSFAVNKTMPVYRWVPWIAKFSSRFVRDIFLNFLDKPSAILDPLASVGTTLVELYCLDIMPEDLKLTLMPPLLVVWKSIFYSPKVLRKVLILQDFINMIRHPELKDLFRLYFASTMIRYSNYSYEPT